MVGTIEEAVARGRELAGARTSSRGPRSRRNPKRPTVTRRPRKRPRGAGEPDRRLRPSQWPTEAHTFDLSLVTPEGVAYEGEADMLIVPGDAGEIGFPARHAPLVAMLRAGVG